MDRVLWTVKATVAATPHKWEHAREMAEYYDGWGVRTVGWPLAHHPIYRRLCARTRAANHLVLFLTSVVRYMRAAWEELLDRD